MSGRPIDSAQLILLVDDDPCFRRAMAIALRLQGFTVMEACDCASALRCLEQASPALVLVDLLLGAERGDEVLESVARVRPEARLVVLLDRPGLQSRMVQSGRAELMNKPVQPEQVVELLAKAG